MTQADLAAKVTKSVSEVSRWENGDRRPKQASLLQLSNIFGIPVQVLQQRAGFTPEFDWLASFLGGEEKQEDILLTASDSEKEELRAYLRYIRLSYITTTNSDASLKCISY
jgi:transcriptional regulator with XRE-family HTH domain